ncbi:hypothetical protein DFH29DRAFT_1004471 [Suillus ampliporus]|nr:hypothetical protein DFH29DRAFT_1004471 [Suillus ampliporus]
MYPPHCSDPTCQTPPTSPLHNPKDYILTAHSNTPPSSSPPSSLCPSSPSGIHILPRISTNSKQIPTASNSLPERLSCSSGLLPLTGSVRGSKRISQSSYHPYVRSTPPTAWEDHKMAKMMGRLAGGVDLDCDDDKAQDIFSRGMQQLSAEAIRRAAHYKEAAREYQQHLIMTSVWEIEKLSRLKSFLQYRQKEQEKDTALLVEEAELFRCMVVDRDAEHASQDLEFVASVQEKEKKTLDRLDSELDELDLLSSDPQTSSMSMMSCFSETPTILMDTRAEGNR